MAENNDPQELKRRTDEFCEGIRGIFRLAITPDLARRAVAWGDSLPTDDDFQQARKEFADQVDRFILRLPAHEFSEEAMADVKATPIAIIALTMERIEHLPMLIQTQAHKWKSGGTLAEFLQTWAIDEWREWFAAGWKEVHGTDPWGAAP